MLRPLLSPTSLGTILELVGIRQLFRPLRKWPGTEKIGAPMMDEYLNHATE